MHWGRSEQRRRQAILDQRDVETHGAEIRTRCQTLAGFVREAWHVLEPHNPLVWSWHLDAICDHLEAISSGRMTPWLIINIPPGSSKSMIVSVLWQAWEWGPGGMSSARFLTTSFDIENVRRDTRKTRDLVMSDWYRGLWPGVDLVRHAETSFANSSTGTREGVAFVSIMGKRGDRVVIDDPHSLKGAESEADRTKAIRLFLEGGLNRLNDQTRSAIVVVMQRVHEVDLTGVLLAHKLGFVHLCIPMEFEPERQVTTPIGFQDPRTYDGELLDPVRFPRASVEKLKSVSSFSWAGQYQQRPVAREGGLFKYAWFTGKVLAESAVPTSGVRWVRHWDLAATKKSDAARTAGVKIGKTRDGRFIVAHVALTRSEGYEVRELIKLTASIDGEDVEISLPQDPGQAGKVQAFDMIQMLAGYVVKAQPETGSKETRAEPFASQCQAGNVWIVQGEWNQTYLDELCLFPGGKYADQVDASANAFGQLVMNEPLYDSSLDWVGVLPRRYA